MDLINCSISEFRNALENKKISAVEATKFFMNRIEKLDSKINSYVLKNSNAVSEAEAIDKRLKSGDDIGPLAGVPMGIKEMFCTQNLRTTACSKILENFVPPYDATVVSKLKNSGAVILGKLNQDEFAMGSSNEHSVFGPVKNPWNLERVPGGSSGGSGAAQAARLAMGTLGTDTGGSIRLPASFCGVVGIKPTYGRVSRFGIIAFASSLDQAGPFASSVADAAIILEVMSGFDEKDSTTSQKTVPRWSSHLTENIKGMKIGLIKEFFALGGISKDVQKSIDEALSSLRSRGAEVIEVSVPLAPIAIPMYYLICASEASSNLARYDGVKYGYRAPEAFGPISLEDFYGKTRGQGFGKEVKRRIMLGTHCLSSGYYDAYYNKACQVRRLLRQQYNDAFKQCDVILSPSCVTPAFKLGAQTSDPLAMYLNDVFTVSTNLAGLPGMSVPHSLSSDGLPIGIQLTASHFEEQKMLNIAVAIEKDSAMKGKTPNVY